MIKKCLYCGKTYEGRSDSRFCSAKCKNTYHNKKRIGELGENLSAVNGEEDTEDEETDFTTPKKTCKTVYTPPEPDYEDEEEEDDYEEDDDDEDENDYEGLYTDLLNDYNALGSRFESETRLSSQYQKRVSELSNELTDKKMENMRLTDRINHLQDRCDYFEKQVNELREEETKRLKKQHDETFSFYDTPDTETEKDEFEDDFLDLLDLRG